MPAGSATVNLTMSDWWYLQTFNAPGSAPNTALNGYFDTYDPAPLPNWGAGNVSIPGYTSGYVSQGSISGSSPQEGDARYLFCRPNLPAALATLAATYGPRWTAAPTGPATGTLTITAYTHIPSTGMPPFTTPDLLMCVSTQPRTDYSTIPQYSNGVPLGYNGPAVSGPSPGSFDLAVCTPVGSVPPPAQSGSGSVSIPVPVSIPEWLVGEDVLLIATDTASYAGTLAVPFTPATIYSWTMRLDLALTLTVPVQIQAPVAPPLLQVQRPGGFDAHVHHAVQRTTRQSSPFQSGIL